MQKLVCFIFTTILALFTALPYTSPVQAANMVVLPLINNVDYPEVEATYFDNVVDCFKQQNKYEYVENEAIKAITDKYTVKGQLPTEEALRNIAQEADADLVVCMELNKLSYTPIANYQDSLYLMDLKGFTVSYNKETNKYDKHKLYIEDELDDGYYVRQNVPLRYWARSIQHEMHRVMQVKGLNIQKQTLQKF